MGKQLDRDPISRVKKRNYDYEESSPTFDKSSHGLHSDSSKKLNYDDDINYGKEARKNQLQDSSPYEYYECEYLGVDDLDKLRRRSLDNV